MDYTLYGVVGAGYTGNRTLEQAVEESIKGGVTVVQLREKSLTGREFYELAKRIKAITARCGIPLIINDRIDIALAVDADGVHLGQDDMPAAVARKLLGSKILGVSAHSVEEAKQAQADGADYLGVGAVFPTATKSDIAGVLHPGGLEQMARSVELPVVGIGGIGHGNVEQLLGTGIAGVAVISAIYTQPDIRESARQMRELLRGLK